MQPNLIIGNPPYDKDIYLDFVTQAHNLSTDSTVMITPAKWQAKAGKKNEEFRDEVVPYMRDIVYYPDTKEVFDILPVGGISYYLLTKTPTADVNITNIENGISKQTTVSNFSDDMVLNIDALKIRNRVMSSPYYKPVTESDDFVPQKSYFYSGQPSREAQAVRDDSSNYFVVNDRNRVPVPKTVFKHQDEVDNYKVYCAFFMLSPTPSIFISTPNEVAGCANALLGFGSKEKCESIKSWYSTHLIGYLMYAFSSANVLSDSTWRFIPTPTAFDHIFTDEELYTRYNLTPDEIQLIESVIKTRKTKN